MGEVGSREKGDWRPRKMETHPHYGTDSERFTDYRVRFQTSKNAPNVHVLLAPEC